MRTRWLGVAVLLLTTGCAYKGTLRPAPSAQPLTDSDTTVMAEAHGVRLLAAGSSWTGYPRDLDRRLTPVEVRLENHSGRPLNVRFEHFALVGEASHAALPPRATDGTFTTHPASFPHPNTYATGRGMRGSPLARQSMEGGKSLDLTYSPSNGATPSAGPPCISCMPPSYALVLPTADMLKQSLREGPLAHEGTRTGFLYFEELGGHERQVELRATLVDANTGEAFGTLSIPFEVH